MHNYVFTRLMLGGSYAFQPTDLMMAAAAAAVLAEQVKHFLKQWRDAVKSRNNTVNSSSSSCVCECVCSHKGSLLAGTAYCKQISQFSKDVTPVRRLLKSLAL